MVIHAYTCIVQVTKAVIAEASPELRRSAVTLHRALTDFVRQYQFRNRNEICCYGITVSQCYLLDTLSTHGPLSMQEAATHLCLKISTVTRLVDGLVKKIPTSRAAELSRAAEGRRGSPDRAGGAHGDGPQDTREDHRGSAGAAGGDPVVHARGSA